MRYIALIFLMIFLSCSSNDDNPITPNSKPQSIKIEGIILNGSEVTIDWSDAKDNDGDKIYYKLYINSILTAETTESITSTTVSYNTDYKGRIIGTDKKGGTTEVNFEFTSLDSKILLYSDSSGTLYAIDLYTKKQIWSTATSFIESHTVSDNLIYSGLKSINGIDILSGEIKWTSKPNINSENIEFNNFIIDNENIYTVGSNSFLYCIDKSTGGKLWDRSFLNYYAQLSIDSDNVFVCSRNNDHLYAINKQNGDIDWGFELDYNSTGAAPKINTNPLIVNNNIYFGDNIGRFYSLNKNTGVKNWSINAGRFNSFYASPTQYKESIIAGTYTLLYAYNLNNGALIWKYERNSGLFKTSPFVYNERIYIGLSKNGAGELICLNANDGTVIWQYDLENNTTSSPIVFEDIVYIGDFNGNMYAIDAQNGSLKWKVKANANIGESPTIVVGNGKTVIYPSVSGLKN